MAGLEEEDMKDYLRDLTLDLRRDYYDNFHVFERLPDLSPEQRPRAIKAISNHVPNDKSIKRLRYYCTREEVETIALPILVEARKWLALSYVVGLRDLVSDAQRRWVVEEASRHAIWAEFSTLIQPFCYDDQVVPAFTQVMGTVCWWVCEEFRARQTHVIQLGEILRTCRLELNEMRNICRDMEVTVKTGLRTLKLESISWHDSFSRLLVRAVFHIVICILTDKVSIPEKEAEQFSQERERVKNLLSQMSQEVVLYVQDKNVCDIFDRVPYQRLLKQSTKITKELKQLHQTVGYQDLLDFLKEFTMCYHGNGRTPATDQALVFVLATIPLLADLQETALKIMLEDKRWDVIARACMSHVSENVRRLLFQSAVEQRRWTVVKRWADHTLYDDQRGWAVEVAFNHKQWDVLVLLADHGLTKTELMRVRYKVTKYAGWKTVLRLLKHGADITEVRQLLEGAKEGRKRIVDNIEINDGQNPHPSPPDRQKRVQDLEKREEFLKKSSKFFKKAVAKGKWHVVLFKLKDATGSEEQVQLALDAAVRHEAWTVVTSLVKVAGLNTNQRDALFPKMVAAQQWGVCRVLLEQRVSVELCLEALPELMEMNQWTLLARVVEYDEIDNDIRRRVLHFATRSREGSLFWHCLMILQEKYGAEERERLFTQLHERCGAEERERLFAQLHERCGAEESERLFTQLHERYGAEERERLFTQLHERYGAEERERLFTQAMLHENWQAVKPLVEEKDDLGVRQRDFAMKEALEVSQWDVVDHCQLHHADIDDLFGEENTALNKAAMRSDWTKVTALIWRGADQSIVDSHGNIALTYAVSHDVAMTKLLISFHGNLLHKDTYGGTPLGELIDRRSADVIDRALLWSPDVQRGVNDYGETPLHAVCQAGDDGTMYYLVVRGVDPLALTDVGQTVLRYAVQNRIHPQRMVAECIKLGFSTHQAFITDALFAKLHGRKWWVKYSISPLWEAVNLDLPVVARMLYESGSCSHAELFRLKLQIRKDIERYDYDHLMSQSRFLERVASKPRTLMSMCRLVISRHLNVRGRRHKDVLKLRISPAMRRFVLFSDLTDPDFGEDITWDT